jgi:hypothetical protein
VGFAVAVSRRGPLGAVDWVAGKLTSLVGVAVGLRHPPRPRESYPVDAVEVVERGSLSDEALRPVRG